MCFQVSARFHRSDQINGEELRGEKLTGTGPKLMRQAAYLTEARFPRVFRAVSPESELVEVVRLAEFRRLERIAEAGLALAAKFHNEIRWTWVAFCVLLAGLIAVSGVVR